MKMLQQFSRLELATLIAEELKANGIDVVLPGGSCVAISPPLKSGTTTKVNKKGINNS